MGSRPTQHKRQQPVRNRQKSDGCTGSQRGARLTSKTPQEIPGASLPTSVAETSLDGLTALDFASVARQLTLATQRRGVRCPLFRSPPDVAGISRSLRQNQDGSVTVSVVVRGRYRLAVLADMIDGVVAANNLEFGDASRLRDGLWSAISAEVTTDVGSTHSGEVVAGRAGVGVGEVATIEVDIAAENLEVDKGCADGGQASEDDEVDEARVDVEAGSGARVRVDSVAAGLSISPVAA